MRCPNCNTDVADHLTVCWACNSNLVTLENYLSKKNKILVIIGVFGALSLYLMQTANSYESNFFLQLGSGISLLVMVVLTSIIISNCYLFIKKYPKLQGDQKGFGYTEWIRQTTDLLYLWAFLAGLCIIVCSVLLFMLFYSKINEIVMTITFGFIFIFLIVAFILLPSDDLMRKKSFVAQLFVVFIFSFLTILWILYLIRDVMRFTRFSFTIDLVIFCLSGFGLINAFEVIIKRADENWNYVINRFVSATTADH